MGVSRNANHLLVGRDAVIADLTRLVDEARRGRPPVVLIEGEAGIGKSAVLAWVRTLCRSRHFSVAQASAKELEQQPLGPLIEALELHEQSADERRRAGARLLLHGDDDAIPGDSAQLSLLSGVDSRQRMLAGIVRLIEDAAVERPSALILDDLQWADNDTIEVVQQLAHRRSRGSLLIVCAFRPSPKPRALVTLSASAPPEAIFEVSLGPLEPAAVEELVAATAGARAGTGLMRVVAGAGGNPFFVRELVAALRDDERIQLHEGIADVPNPGLPPSLRTTIIRRMAALPEETQQALRWGSVLGSSFSVADLALVTATSLPAVLAKLQPALDAHFLVADGPRLQFRHDLVHEAIYSDTPGAIRAAHHLHVGRTLVGAGSGPLTVAAHFDRGAQGHEREAASWLKHAADEVELRSPASAVGLLRRALELSPQHDQARTAVLFSLVRALLWSGDWTQAEEEARRALERDEGASIDGTLRYVMARALVYRGRTGDSVKEARKALQYDLPAHDRARLLADLTMRLPLLGDLDDGERAADEAINLANQHGDRLAISTALSGLGLIHCLRGRPRRGIEIAESALPRGDGSISESVEFVQPYFYHAIALVEGDAYESAADVLERLRLRTEEMGMVWARGLTEGLVADLDFRRGRWAAALDAAAHWRRLVEQTGTRVWMVMVLSAETRIATHRGDLASAERTASSAESFIAEAGSHHLGMERWSLARGLLREAQGDVDGALATLLEGWRRTEQLGFLNGRRELGPDLARLAAHCDDPGLARSVADALLSSASDAGCATYTAAAVRASGHADRDPAKLLDAAATYASIGRPLEAAICQEGAGALNAAMGAAKTAAQAFSEALIGYEDLGAARDASRITSSLRSAGVIRGVRRRRNRATNGWASLTATEREVARRAAEGMTNREIGAQMFISPRTVATHLEHVFAKLEISSRVELAAAAARLDQPY